jgi:nucleolar protein 12
LNKTAVLIPSVPHKKSRKPVAQSPLSVEETKPHEDDIPPGIDEPDSSDSSISENDASDDPGSDDEDDFNPAALVHESLQHGSSKHGSAHQKYVPPDETPEQRNARTIFIGNVPIDSLKNRVRRPCSLLACAYIS